jgi:predicted nucleotide-binding protein (sugar kinase/HSP70/actin superfamily)
MPLRHRHSSCRINADNPLNGKVVYIPAMAEGSVELFAAVFRWLGIEAYPTPKSEGRTLELGGKHTNGDECYPAKITVGDFFRILERPHVDPAKTVFFMATAEGPCRFGQYAPYLKKILAEAGRTEVQVLSPTSKNGYTGLGEVSGPFVRAAWRALVMADVLRKAMLKTRPYETTPGATDKAFWDSIEDVAKTIETMCGDPKCQLQTLIAAMTRSRERFHRVPTQYSTDNVLIGVVGEIFCRLNNFSNDDLVRKLESYGAEARLSDIAEWIGYTNTEVVRRMKLVGKGMSLDMLKEKIRSHVQHSDEHALAEPFHHDFEGYEEPPIEEVLDLAWPYLPANGALGEMVLSIGKAAWMAKNGADGIVDISPFTCMNGIVSEAIYPKLSADFGGIPIRNFYFDGTQSDLDRDLGIYMELARSYKDKKPHKREYPSCFHAHSAAD